jgi:hypothetical protein
MMYFTAALVACSLLSTLVSGYQAHVASISAAAAKSTADTAARTLAEIQKSGTDTHTVAEAAGKQATNMERLATVATGQADTANQSMYIGQRAWVFPQDVYTETPQTILSLPFFACDKAADHTFRFARHSRTIVTIARGVGYWDSHFLTARLDPVSKAKMS